MQAISGTATQLTAKDIWGIKGGYLKEMPPFPWLFIYLSIVFKGASMFCASGHKLLYTVVINFFIHKYFFETNLPVMDSK